MRKLQLNNPEILEDLKEFERFVTPDYIKFFELRGKSFEKDTQEYACSQEYLKEMLGKGREGHEGYPDIIKSYSLQHNTLWLDKKCVDYDRAKAILNEAWHALSNLAMKYSLKNNALFAVYPPGGFIGWHNNANASAYNMIFTWSETGEGDFTYYDKENKKLVQMKDDKGWSCKMGYFSHWDDPEPVTWHCAKTDCWRMTVSFVFDRSERSKQIQQWVIEDIESYK